MNLMYKHTFKITDITLNFIKESYKKKKKKKLKSYAKERGRYIMPQAMPCCLIILDQHK